MRTSRSARCRRAAPRRGRATAGQPGQPEPAIRATAGRSLGKLAKSRHMTPEERAGLREACASLLRPDEAHEHDRAHVVRREAKEALHYL